MYYLISLYLMLLSMVYFSLGCLFMKLKVCMVISWLLLETLSFKIEFFFFIDWMSLMFLGVVSLITSMVVLYSIEYMGNTVSLSRFMLLILVFYLSMKLMVISPNLFSILLGWDGLGVSSYCLIIFYQSKKSLNSGFMTILMNRVGDISILAMIALLLGQDSLSIMFLDKIFKYSGLSFVILIGMTKSAQIPFSSWLPLAMAAPTPVSALVHSSTLVTAGVYLFIRFSYILDGYLYSIMLFISCWTMFMSSVSAMFEYDLKKIIALSTLSQLGLMIMTVSMGFPILAFFHLLTHAMFKSLLFLCSGIMIHCYFNTQDIRYISLVNLKVPFVAMVFCISSMALCGIPFLSGFYSKDLLVEMYNMSVMNSMIFNIMYVSMMNTVIYTIRLIMWMVVNSLFVSHWDVDSVGHLMVSSLIILFFMTIMFGSILSWLIFSSLDLVVLDKNSKTLIYKVLTFSFMFSLMTYFMKLCFNTKFCSFINNMWGFQLMWKGEKINFFYFSSRMVELKDLGWVHWISIEMLINLLLWLSTKDYSFKLKFFIILIFTILLAFMVYYFG